MRLNFFCVFFSVIPEEQEHKKNITLKTTQAREVPAAMEGTAETLRTNTSRPPPFGKRKKRLLLTIPDGTGSAEPFPCLGDELRRHVDAL